MSRLPRLCRLGAAAPRLGTCKLHQPARPLFRPHVRLLSARPGQHGSEGSPGAAASKDARGQQTQGSETGVDPKTEEAKEAKSSSSSCSSEDQAAACEDAAPKEATTSSRSSDSSEDKIQVVLETRNLLDIMTTPLRHGTHLITLSFVGLMVPLEWSWSDFSDGAEQAVRAVHSLLGEEDFAALRGLLTEQLLQDLRERDTKWAQAESWSAPPRLIEAEAVAVFSSRAMPANDHEAPAIRVTPLMKVLEEYHYEGEASPRRMRRLMKWEFERKVESDGPLPWQICSLGQQWFVPHQQGRAAPK
eukprot:TRINITY_DN32187_c0_g1_i2.p1 TRINITY_DN32187_c0_g1~~TRINITY_DN32187_c0_g1_i2.p1  ORF type:complete len:303 (+),score=71.31 TRINITY_DN32187_c0_g1_i2:35-943(+)